MTKFWNDLPSKTVEAVELKKFKPTANAYLLGVAIIIFWSSSLFR